MPRETLHAGECAPRRRRDGRQFGIFTWAPPRSIWRLTWQVEVGESSLSEEALVLKSTLDQLLSSPDALLSDELRTKLRNVPTASPKRAEAAKIQALRALLIEAKCGIEAGIQALAGHVDESRQQWLVHGVADIKTNTARAAGRYRTGAAGLDQPSPGHPAQRLPARLVARRHEREARRRRRGIRAQRWLAALPHVAQHYYRAWPGARPGTSALRPACSQCGHLHGRRA
jgi:hypothetical protein